MMEDNAPIGGLILGQFSLKYGDLIFREDIKGRPTDQQIYRSRSSRHLFVYHEEADHWDCFVETFL